MSYSIEFNTRGLAVTAEIEAYDCGDRWDPPSGGTCEKVEWSVDDIDEVMESLEIDNELLERVLRADFARTGELPLTIAATINDEWDLMEAATEYFWHDIGGPEGLE